MHEKLGNSDLAFQVYSKIVNCNGPNSNLDFVTGSYFSMAKIHQGRNEYAKSREHFVKFLICAKKMHDLKQMMGIPLFTQEPENLGKMVQDSVPLLLQTGGQITKIVSQVKVNN